jgi:molybdate transport system substrate-binding protein
MAEVKVLCSLAMKAALTELAPRFERDSGNRVAAQWVGGADIGKRLRAGDASDLVIMAAAGIDDLIKEGLLAAGSRVDLVRSRIAVAVRAGAARPDISSAQAVKRAVLAARRTAYSSGPSGVYLAKVFERWQVPAQKLHQTPPGAPAGDVVARGEAEIAFQQLSELMPIEGIDLVGPLPDDLQLVTVFSAARNVKSASPDAVASLCAFLSSRAIGPVLAKHGLDPA